jgi:acetate---CoA ligase (ADP-forming)
MNRLFFPESLVIVGVSESPSNRARKVLQNLARFGFKGNVYCVGRRQGDVEGVRILTHLEDIERTPDVAVLLVPVEMIVESLEACGRKGIPYAVIETAGFSEFDNDREELERRIRQVATKWNIMVMGPNCVGAINLQNGLALPFYPLEEQKTTSGRVSFISQSGALLHDVLALCDEERLGLNKLVSIGNKLMLNENHFLESLIADASTGVIGLYLESIADGRYLMELASSSKKPIIVLKANRSESSRQIARFHTSSLMGDDQVFDRAMFQSGMHRVENLTQMIDLFKIFHLPILKGPNLLIISRSGGQAVMLVDAAHRYGLSLAPLSADFLNFMRRRFGPPRVINITNPVDVADIFDVEGWGEIVEKGLEQEQVDGVVFSPHFAWIEENDAARKAMMRIGSLSITYDKPVVVCSLPDYKTHLDRAAYPHLFSDADAALTALKTSLRHFHAELTRTKVPAPIPTVVAPSKKKLVRRVIPVDETYTLLANYGLPIANYALVSSLQDGLAAAHNIGYPVALKIATTGIVHKTEKGGVRLNIENEVGLKRTFDEMNAEEYLIQKMISGHEFIVGAKQDHEFGPVILFGMGGILVELFRDTAVRFIPIDEAIAFDMLAEIRASAILDGYRGSKPLDKQAVAKCLVSVSTLMAEHPEIIQLDLNPLMVLERGRGCYIVDAKLEQYVETE